jgi:hypothetical protein
MTNLGRVTISRQRKDTVPKMEVTHRLYGT